MVTLPSNFVSTKYAGYFFNISDKQLYSVKVTGMLKPLTKCKASFFNDMTSGYNISVKGYRKFLPLDYLNKLVPAETVFPVFKENS